MRLAPLAATLLLAALPAAAADDLQPGQYKTTISSDPPMTQVAGPFTRDSFDMKIQMQLEPKGKPNAIRMFGKRIGPCAAK